MLDQGEGEREEPEGAVTLTGMFFKAPPPSLLVNGALSLQLSQLCPLTPWNCVQSFQPLWTHVTHVHVRNSVLSFVSRLCHHFYTMDPMISHLFPRSQGDLLHWPEAKSFTCTFLVSNLYMWTFAENIPQTV